MWYNMTKLYYTEGFSMKNRILLVLMVLCFILTACGNSVNLDDYVTKEEYEKVIKERDTLNEQVSELISESNKEMVDFFSYDEAINVFEIDTGSKKTLGIFYYLPIFTDSEEISDSFTKLWEKIFQAKFKSWFDYDYVTIDIWSDSLGRITSMTMEADDLSSYTQFYGWYQTEESEKNGTRINSNLDENFDTLIYQDENIIVTYNGISGKENSYDINFVIENLSDKTLIIQVRETSINGFMVNPICSIEIAPGKKAIDGMTIRSTDAENHPMSTVENIETKFHIYTDDWEIRYDTENVVIK